MACGISLAVVHRLSCPVAFRILVARPGIELASPALQGEFLTTGPPGESLPQVLKLRRIWRGWQTQAIYSEACGSRILPGPLISLWLGHCDVSWCGLCEWKMLPSISANKGCCSHQAIRMEIKELLPSSQPLHVGAQVMNWVLRKWKKQVKQSVSEGGGEAGGRRDTWPRNSSWRIRNIKPEEEKIWRGREKVEECWKERENSPGFKESRTLLSVVRLTVLSAGESMVK